MRHPRWNPAWACAGLLGLLLNPGCADPKPSLSGRLATPADVLAFKGCPQSTPDCDPTVAGALHHLLLVANSQVDELRVFDADTRTFFKARNPLFPFSIPVGSRPRSLAIDPTGRWAFVVNGLSEDLSLVDLRPDRMIEVDTDMNSATCAASLHPDSDRCRAGVSRVGLGEASGGLPEAVVAEASRVEGQPLRLWVSLAGAGQVAELRFDYPDEATGWPQRLVQERVIPVGGVPSGLALSADGSALWIADEAGDSVVRLDTHSGAVQRVVVGGPSRRVALTPDGTRLYVLRLDEPLVSLVDPAQDALVAPGACRDTASDPDSGPEGIRLPGIPRELTFVVGVPYLVADESGQPRAWTTELLTAEEREAQGVEETEVTTLAYVNDLNGNVYILDAVNHRPIDRLPFAGASCTIPGYNTGGTTLDTTLMEECAITPACEHPVLADFHRTYDGSTILDPIFHGVWVATAVTRIEDWVLRWNGALPGTGRSVSGRFEGWRFRDERAVVDFLTLGVEPGDLLVVQSSPREAIDGSGGVHPSCSPGTGAAETGEARTYFVVAAVEAQALGLRPVEGMDPGLCWPEAVRYEVRVDSAWTVWSSIDGFVGRAPLSPRQDPPPEPPVFDNGRVAFTIFAPAPDEEGAPRLPARNSTWGFSTDSGHLPGIFAPSVVLGFGGRLVAVDMDDTLAEPGARVDDRIYAIYEGSEAMLEFFPAALESNNYIVYQ